MRKIHLFEAWICVLIMLGSVYAAGIFGRRTTYNGTPPVSSPCANGACANGVCPAPTQPVVPTVTEPAPLPKTIEAAPPGPRPGPGPNINVGPRPGPMPGPNFNRGFGGGYNRGYGYGGGYNYFNPLPYVINYATQLRPVLNPVTGQTEMLPPGQWVQAPAGSAIPFVYQRLPMWPLLGSDGKPVVGADGQSVLEASAVAGPIKTIIAKKPIRTIGKKIIGGIRRIVKRR